MPTIRLKPNSAEFDNGQEEKNTYPPCDMTNCTSTGAYKAPRDRSLNEHYHFCKEHITEYNRAWNFFDGMNPAEVEEHMTSAFYGDRPTWKYREFATLEETLFTKINDLHGDTPHREQAHKEQSFENHSPEMEALSIMNLSPPVTLEEIKKEYKILAKKHHPDHNNNDPKAEELLKRINMAYTILKAAYGKYENLMAK